ncbi:hypothetical protein [Aquimarina sp. AU474]|uniref:hypothetical protein n=1 Tax=Aquimarina sp. AU474 TaxID=2108529 RepID=UPI000D6989BB|nr:hypothetical protein [Aquimarina sp. AU474]
MNEKKENIKNFLRQTIFILVVFTMIIQPITQTFAFFTQSDYELANYDYDKDTKKKKKKKEKKEKDSKDEKIEIQVSEYSYLFANNKKSLCSWAQASLWDVHLEILIPPPERV